eukprot:11227100-Lingulodinium_polyedra.AAC.1
MAGHLADVGVVGQPPAVLKEIAQTDPAIVHRPGHLGRLCERARNVPAVEAAPLAPALLAGEGAARAAAALRGGTAAPAAIAAPLAAPGRGRRAAAAAATQTAAAPPKAVCERRGPPRRAANAVGARTAEGRTACLLPRRRPCRPPRRRRWPRRQPRTVRDRRGRPCCLLWLRLPARRSNALPPCSSLRRGAARAHCTPSRAAAPLLCARVRLGRWRAWQRLRRLRPILRHLRGRLLVEAALAARRRRGLHPKLGLRGQRWRRHCGPPQGGGASGGLVFASARGWARACGRPALTPPPARSRTCAQTARAHNARAGPVFARVRAPQPVTGRSVAPRPPARCLPTNASALRRPGACQVLAPGRRGPGGAHGGAQKLCTPSPMGPKRLRASGCGQGGLRN